MARRAAAVHTLELVPQRRTRQGGRRTEPRQSVDVTLRTSDRMLLTVEEAAERLDLGRSTMHQLIAAGLIDTIRFGWSTESNLTVAPHTPLNSENTPARHMAAKAAPDPDHAHHESRTVLPDLGASPTGSGRPRRPKPSPPTSGAVGHQTPVKHANIARLSIGGSPCR